MAARFVRPILLTAALCLAAWILARSPLPAIHAQSQVVGSGSNRAGLVVRFADGQVETRCVAFEEQEIGGDELLRRSGLTDIILSPEGAVCSINGKGCPSDDCFCQCPFPNCEYWAYYRRDNGAWTYSQTGATYTAVQDGVLDGWSWGQGDFSQAVEPPQLNFDQVCPANSADATATATATATTQVAAPTSPPQVSFYATPPALTSGQCTILNWLTTGASSVMLDGAPVAAQGSQQVCPNTTQAWTLIASNTAGQTTRQVSVSVQSASGGGSVATNTPAASATASLRPPATAFPTGSAPRQLAPTVPVPTQRPVSTRAPQPLPGGTLVAALPSAPTPDLRGGGVPLAPTSEPLPAVSPTPDATATRFEFSVPPTETPKPTRALSPDDPTPTPILIARADGRISGGLGQPASGSAAAAGSAAPSSAIQSVRSRSFSPDLLPGYAAYVASVGVLLIMGWYVLRRRHEHVRVGKDE